MNIYDIAEKSGVSVSTVSRVINGTARVREETKQKVLSVIRDTGFQPNAFAQALNFNSMGMIGVLCTNFADSYYSRVVAHLEKHLRDNNLNVTLVCPGQTIAEKKEGIRALKAKGVDAIVLIGATFLEVEREFIADISATCPLFTLSYHHLDLPNVHSVCCDERGAVKDVVTKLIAAGLPRVLFVCEHIQNSNNTKYSGYRDAYEACGLPLPELLLPTGCYTAEAEPIIADFLAANADRIDAVLTGNDELAAFTLKAMHRLGISRPVVGFNNSLLSQQVIPELTSVDNRVEEMCRLTAANLVAKLQKQEVPQRTVISAELVRRESF